VDALDQRTTYAYDGQEPTSQTDANGHATYFLDDKLSPDCPHLPDGKREAMTYDPPQPRDPDRLRGPAHHFTYDDNNRLTSRTTTPRKPASLYTPTGRRRRRRPWHHDYGYDLRDR
jgi:YD repeat-containing protein